MTGAGIVIVGGGHGGGTAATMLRQAGYAGKIQIISEEALPPYHRPLLSKGFLKGDATLDSLRLRPDAYYAKADIDMRLGTRVTAVDPIARSLTLETGDPVRYDTLILATGSTARRLAIPGAELGGVHMLRSIADAEGLRTRLAPGKRLVVIGAGYVGLEVAASARALGCEVTVIERESRLLARVAGEVLSRFFEAIHRKHGVTFLTDAGVTALEGSDDGLVSRVVLAEGSTIACDAVLVGIGGQPCDALARDCGLACDGGVVVDLAGRTSVAGIYAIGDMTVRPLPHYGDRHFRLESVPNALEQAKAVAADIMGNPAPASELPWFWSDQYDTKLQIAGIALESDRIVVRGSIEDRRFSIFHMQADRVRCIEAINSPGDFMAGKKLIAAGIPVRDDQIRDPDTALKSLVA